MLKKPFLLLASVCVVVGTLFIFYRNYQKISTENMKVQLNLKTESFQLSPDNVTSPIVVPRLFKGNKGYLLSDCQLSLHHGVQKCTNTSSLRFYMDADTETCLAFKYSGCGGNSNNFDTWGKCMRCFAADYSGCPVGSALVKNTDRNTTTCEVRGDEKCTGPNSYCRRGAFFGFCCDKTIRDKENSDQNMKEGCGPGMKKVSQKTLSGFDITLLGKTCGSKFCPQKSTCHQGNYFAYCCAAAV